MFIDYGYQTYTQAPEGRHVIERLDTLILEKVLDSVRFC